MFLEEQRKVLEELYAEEETEIGETGTAEETEEPIVDVDEAEENAGGR